MSLTNLPTLWEIKEIVHAINFDSVVGPDDFTTKFFQKAWDIKSGDFYGIALDLFAGNIIPLFFCGTSIVHIPKKTIINKWDDLWPISIFTFFSKLIFKYFLNHLSLLFPSIISLTQMGFLKWRSISYNILLP